MNKRHIITLAILVIAIGFGVFLFNQRDTDPVPPKDLEKVTVAQTGDFLLYSVIYIAEDAGIFERNGLDVEITSVGGDENAVAAVVAGQAEFGVGDPTFAAIARERGQGVSVIASVVNGVPFWGVTYSDDVANRYRKTALSGLRVATFPAPSTAFALQDDMYSDLGLQPLIVEGAFGSLIGILESGRADIALELEPNVSLMTANGAQVLYSFADMYGDFAITGLTVSDSYKSTHPEVVRAVVASLQEAMELARTDKERVIRLLSARFPELEQGVIEESYERMLTEGVIPSRTSIAADAWAKAIDLRIEVGDIEDRKTALSALDNFWGQDR